MPRPNTKDVQMPGATSDTAVGPVAYTHSESPEDEIARLKAELAAAKAVPASKILFEPVTPHGAEKMAASQFLHLTSAQMDAKVRSGELTMTEPHVLCADGYYCNPNYR